MATLSITLADSDALRVQNFARETHTTVEDLFVTFVGSLSARGTRDNHATADDALARLNHSFQTLSRPLSGKGYSNRDELYER